MSSFLLIASAFITVGLVSFGFALIYFSPAVMMIKGALHMIFSSMGLCVMNVAPRRLIWPPVYDTGIRVLLEGWLLMGLLLLAYGLFKYNRE